MPAGISLLLGAAASVGACGIVWRCEQRRVRAARAELFADCEPVLDRCRVVQDGLDYPRLQGTFAGHTVDVRAIPDSAALRKLPILWLQVSLVGETWAPGVLDVLLRPLGSEYWSPAHELPMCVPTPADLPETAQLRADAGPAVLLLPTVARHATFLQEPDTKEMLLTPRGVRIVVRLAEAERGSYLLVRDAQFPIGRLEPDRLHALLALFGFVLFMVSV
ncbi:MAG: hypothetical protein ACJ8H8_32655, partial [Geminicoccaceae bacterium]